MYIKSRSVKRRERILTIIAVGTTAFFCTLLALGLVFYMRWPDRLSAAQVTKITPAPSDTLRAVLPTLKATLPTLPSSPTPAAARTSATTVVAKLASTFVPRPIHVERPPTPTATPFPQHIIQAYGTPVAVVEHLLLNHPVPPDSEGISPEWHYLYATTEGGTLRVHHGDDFDNPLGTPLFAVADGTVVIARPDDRPLCGIDGDQICGAHADFYGNFVVLRLDEAYYGQPIYILYGHMDSIAVAEGDHVVTGQQIGVLGSTGVSEGPHVHVEVRIGVNDYAHTRNTSLWLKPLAGHGILSGRILDERGEPVVGGVVDLYDATGTNEVEFTETYGKDDTPSVNGDDEMHENFALPDLPSGTYVLRVEIGSSSYYKTVTVDDGHITFVVMRPS